MNVHATGRVLQSFRLAPESVAEQGGSSSDDNSEGGDPIHNISAYQDTHSMQLFVLWRDIKLVYNCVDFVKDSEDGSLVPFMIDTSTFQPLQPKRILYHPNKVLDVVLSSQSPNLKRGPSKLKRYDSDALFLEPAVAQLRIQTPEPYDKDHAPPSPTISLFRDNSLHPQSDVALRRQTSVSSFHEIQQEQTQAVLIGQALQAEGIKIDMAQHFERVKAETDRIIESQHQMMDRLATIQASVQAVIVQTYELHEYPIPRLFIILPKTPRTLDYVLKPFSNQFRLYFLCECGAHTTRDGSREMDRVHLAHHPGYDIERPTEFFQKYGPYVLAVLRMVQAGTRVAETLVPLLQKSNFAQDLMCAEKDLSSLQKEPGFYNQKKVCDMVSNAVSYLENTNTEHDRRGMKGAPVNMNVNQSIMDDARVIESVELKHLDRYLSCVDPRRTFGDLYRSVTSDGHVKWVCRTHFRQNYREQALKNLCDTVEANRGVYEEQYEKVTIRLASRTLAGAFYAALIQAHIQELDITLAWDVTMMDLQVFVDSVLKSTIVSLSMDGQDFDGPFGDLGNRRTRFEPLIRLLTDGRLQVLQLRQFKEMFKRISNLSSIESIPALRSLDICWAENYQELLPELIKKCTKLQRLTIDSNYGFEVEEILKVGRNLQILEVNFGEVSADTLLAFVDWVAKIKNEHKDGGVWSLRSLVITGKDFGLSVSFSTDGITQVAPIRWGSHVMQPLLDRYGWALKELDLSAHQTSEARARFEEGLEDLHTRLDLVRWAGSLEDNGRPSRSLLESVKFNGSLFKPQYQSDILSIVEKSPRLTNMGLVLGQRRLQPKWWTFDSQEQEALPYSESDMGGYPSIVHLQQPISLYLEETEWCLNNLASKATKLELIGATAIRQAIEYLSNGGQKNPLPNLTELRLVVDDDLESSDINFEQFQQLFQSLDLTALTFLGIDHYRFSQAHWELLLEILPQTGLLENGQPLPPLLLANLEIRSTLFFNGADVEALRAQLATRAPRAYLEVLNNVEKAIPI